MIDVYRSNGETVIAGGFKHLDFSDPELMEDIRRRESLPEVGVRLNTLAEANRYLDALSELRDETVSSSGARIATQASLKVDQPELYASIFMEDIFLKADEKDSQDLSEIDAIIVDLKHTLGGVAVGEGKAIPESAPVGAFGLRLREKPQSTEAGYSFFGSVATRAALKANLREDWGHALRSLPYAIPVHMEHFPADTQKGYSLPIHEIDANEWYSKIDSRYPDYASLHGNGPSGLGSGIMDDIRRVNERLAADFANRTHEVYDHLLPSDIIVIFPENAELTTKEAESEHLPLDVRYAIPTEADVDSYIKPDDNE
jgi:hypothetical protein